MKKYKMLGVNSKSGSCCILSCLLPFTHLSDHISELEASDFKHTCTNWNGCDSVERTLELENMVQTGCKIVLEKPISFQGADDDMGHSYSWSFKVNEIHELSEKKKVGKAAKIGEIVEVAEEFLELRSRYKGDEYSWEKAYEDIQPIVDKIYYLTLKDTSEGENLLSRLLWREIKREEEDLYIKAFADKKMNDGN